MSYDKMLHMIAGFGFGTAGGLVSPACGFLLAFAVGLGKELYDRYDYGQFDWLDLAATCCGGILGVALMEGVKWIS